MASPLSYKSKGLPHRTVRDIARAHGTKVPPKPAANGYCPVHGMVADGCSPAKVDEEAETISRSGGSSRLPASIKPFKLGG